MFKLFILGISGQQLSDKHNAVMASCSLIVGTERFKKLTDGFQARFENITPLADSISSIKKILPTGNVCVLASGDPLFYGIAKLLLKHFPKNCVEILPAVSALQSGCALFKLPWDDAEIISLHGRSTSHLPGMLLARPKTIVFTDRSTAPNILARKIINYLRLIKASELLDSIVMHVAEDLGMPSQNVTSDTLSAISKKTFSQLNIAVIEMPEKAPQYNYVLGLREEDIEHSRGLITKNEVRAATLHRLQLPPRGVFWDIGAGSGSISIEAARLNPHLTVYAVEQKQEEIDNIKNNIVTFGCFNIVPVHGGAPDVLASLPAPDRIFVGGSGGALDLIIQYVAERCITGDVRLVINGVLDKTVQKAPMFMKQCGFSVEKATISVTREKVDGTTLTLNPITLVTGIK